jgi:hypothetical protein
MCTLKKCSLKLSRVLPVVGFRLDVLQSSKKKPVLNTKVLAVLIIFANVKDYLPASATSAHSSIWLTSNLNGVLGSQGMLMISLLVWRSIGVMLM